jgi:hypothetical protein
VRKHSLLFVPLILLSLAQCRQSTPKEERPSPYPVEDSLVAQAILPSAVHESSGLVLLDGLWTHNDSGDSPVLYQVSTDQPKVLQRVKIKQARARDWEDITRDSAFVYIGDFGNNSGRRQDLVIYKVAIDSLVDGDDTATAEAIYFSYPDQTDFEPPAYQHNFDCEALISLGDSLYLFSKNHQDLHSRLYALPKTPGTHVARLKSRMNTDGVITGADIDPESGLVVLLGYRFNSSLLGESFDPFVWLLSDYTAADFFSGQALRVDLPFRLQTEGICHFGNGQLLISHEVEGGGTARLYRFDSKKWLE